MLGRNLFNEAEFHRIGAPIALGSAIDNDSNVLDRAGFDNVLVLATITDSVALGEASMTLYANALNQTAGASATAATVKAISQALDDLNGKLLVLDVRNPLERYVFAKRQSAVANIAFGEALAILYNGRVKSVEQLAAEVAAAAFFAAPATV